MFIFTNGDRDMNEDEWLDGLRHLSNDQILKVHFELQDKIKKHYKLREKGNNLEKAVNLCVQQIALAPLAIKALKSAHNKRVADYSEHIKKPHPDPYFTAPSHHGYRQYIIILRRKKDFDTLRKLELKRKSEGWAD